MVSCSPATSACTGNDAVDIRMFNPAVAVLSRRTDDLRAISAVRFDCVRSVDTCHIRQVWRSALCEDAYLPN